VRPCPVVGEQPSLELAKADVVQLPEREPRHVAAVEREVGRLPRAQELRRYAEVDLVSCQLAAELSCLLAADVRQADGDRRIAVRAADDGEHAFGVTREDDPLHRLTLTGGGRSPSER
jgi:hypothetical protein